MEPAQLLARLRTVRDEIVARGERRFAAWLPKLARPAFRESARNLAYYLALREMDLRELQVALMPFGMSSLGRCESHVAANLDAVIAGLARIVGEPNPPPFPGADAFFSGERLLRAATEAVYGPTPESRTVRIMVTLPSEAATDPGLARSYVEAGMNVARINCAHDDEAAWRAMAANVRAASAATGRACAICVDIAGPKVRVESVRSTGATRVLRGEYVLLGPPGVGPEAGARIALGTDVHHLLAGVRPGQSVWIDDGKVGTRVADRTAAGLLLEVVSAPEGGARLAPEKGLNFPDIDLAIPALTSGDRPVLPFVADAADIVGFSFVGTPADVDDLCSELERLRDPALPPVAVQLKIETTGAVRNLPDLIVAAAERGPVGVMIARGDLAVNIGYRRLAEIQEELLWLCESAHVPVVWATQVLERLVKKGRASRGEFTDAAMAERAECVMLNKGPYLVEALHALDDVLARMEGHQTKKTSRLRPLRSWAQEEQLV